MRYPPSTFRNIFYILMVFTLIGCKKNAVPGNSTTQPPPSATNNPPGPFAVSLVASSWDTATISWTQAIDPDNDSVYYKVYLNDILIADNHKVLNYTFRNLKEVTPYSVKVVAVDAKLKEASSVASFTTKKYWLKFLKKVEYGIKSTYTSKTTGQMIKANDGGFIMVAYVDLVDWPGEEFKLCTVKIDSLGNKLWEKLYDYNVGIHPLRIVSNNNNGYVLCGGNNLIRIGNNGDLIWQRSIGNQEQRVNGVAVYSDGSIYAAGYVISDSVNINITEALLAKYDQNGNLSWKKRYSPTNRDAFYDIKIYSNEIVVLGETDDVAKDFRVAKLNMDGTVVWDKRYHQPGATGFPENIIKTSEGNYVFTGYFVDARIVFYLYLQMVDANGNKVWTYYANDNNLRGYSVVETKDNALMVTGGYQLTYSAQSCLYKFDKTGNILWRKLYEELATYFLNKTIIPTDDGGFIINSQKSKAYNSYGETDQIYIFKTDDKGEFN